MKKSLASYIRNNLGLLNLFGKSFGRVLFLLLTSFLAYKLSVEDFAAFAIFWTTTRMLVFLSSNNLYIVYFGQVRKDLMEHKRWSQEVSSNLFITHILLGLLSCIITYVVLKDLTIALLMFPLVLLGVVIRNIGEFAKSDDSLSLSIFIEDFLYYVLFFGLGVVGLYLSNGLMAIVVALLIASFVTALVALVMFKRKFNLVIRSYRISFRHFSLEHIRLGAQYTIMRGNEFFANFGVRYIGQLCFGDVFVAYAHIMYQFYNVFLLITMSVISGFQSKIVIKEVTDFNKRYIKRTYGMVVKTLLPLVLTAMVVVVSFNDVILNMLFPKYSSYAALLAKIALIGGVVMVVQPLVFVLIYNNKFVNIKSLNLVQYIGMFVLFAVPFVFAQFNQEVWLLLAMVSFVAIQGVFALINYKKIQ